MAGLLAGFFWCCAARCDELVPGDVPPFRLRARVVLAGRQPPQGKGFRFGFSVSPQRVTAQESAWSDWLSFGPSEIEATLKGYPAIYLRGYPVVVKLHVADAVDPTVVEAELNFEESAEVFRLKGELFGPTLGILVWRNADKKPQAATMAEYNRRYWKELESVQIPAELRPRRFLLVDRFIGGDDDRIAWREGIEQLNRAGFTAIMLPPSETIRQLLLPTGTRRTSWAVYCPPGYAFDFDPKFGGDSLKDWAVQQAQPYRQAGYAPEDMAIFALSDEPGWYYPRALRELQAQPTAMARFREYLKSQGLSPADVGAASWDDVQPIGRSQATDPVRRRLFYWTMRFFSYDSARYFADATRALEEAFYPGMPIFTNWNFFSGRFYVPGPVANNSDKDSPDAAMGGHDWFEFARLRGGTMLWTEDWFSDAQAYQWSFYCSKLRCAARKGGVNFGGYVIPRTAGDRADGILQKILCITGSGGKAIKYFVFGPEYNFPGNCYSERAQVLAKMAEAHRMIGAAERLLWPGQRPPSDVAILMPRSAQVWDAKYQPIARGIEDATNTQLNRHTVDYMAEVFDLYLALQHANIPVDFVEEDDLNLEGLKAYRVLYVTAPNVPVEHQRGIVQWLQAGGTLVTVTGALQADRYDEPCRVVSDAVGFREKPRERLIVSDTRSLPVVARASLPDGSFEAVGVRGFLEQQPDGDLIVFDDGTPAVVEKAVGQGRIVHFTWLPGVAYWCSWRQTKDRLPVGFSEVIRGLIIRPVEQAGVVRPVETNHPLVETPLLQSEAGVAVTLLNWTGEPIDELLVKVRVPFLVKSVESVRLGKLHFTTIGNGIELRLPLGSADILLIE